MRVDLLHPGHRRWRALVVAACLFLVVPGAAQVRQDSAGTFREMPAPPGQKDPRLAGALSVFVPGLGHLYAGETLKGTVLSGIFVGSIVAVIGADIGQTNASITPAAWGAITLLGGVYLYALIDAPFAADRANARGSEAHLMRIRADGTTVVVDAGVLLRGPAAVIRWEF
jgi:TM2 domain-containing membrane protein YozV